MVAERAADFFRGLTRETVIISHGAFGRILRGLYCGLTWKQMSEMEEPQGVVFRLQAGSIARIEPPLRKTPV
jgi:probable phosphoglycerate mutase